MESRRGNPEDRSKRERNKKIGKYILAIFAVVMFIAVSFNIYVQATTVLRVDAPNVKTYVNKIKDRDNQITTVSFSAVGDNLIHDVIYNAAAVGDGTYDFDYMYEPLVKYNQQHDVNFINQETPVGGTELGLSGYPQFNSPYEVIDSLSNSGYNWIGFANNHSYDAGEQGILNELEYVKQFENITTTGVHENNESYNTPTVIEKNGIKIGLLSYTYGLNGFVLPAGKEYLVDVIDEDIIRYDIEKLNEVSDVQIVSMHWGQENSTYPSYEQEYYAQLLSDLGVEVVIGAHPHVLQPIEYLTGENNNQTLVIYSLGNLVSAQLEAINMLGGMATFDVSLNKLTGTTKVSNVVFMPTVTHVESSWTGFTVYPLKEYTDELAQSHHLITRGEPITIDYFTETTDEIIGDSVTIDY